MDAPLAANSGHQGTAMSLAPLAHVLYSRILKHDPTSPDFIDRDRLILSNGHASILQYAMLFLSGYGLEMSDLKLFRQWKSATPGHPEVGHTAGVEVTTGPLGQGFANAVGMAIAESHLRAVHGQDAINHHTYVIAGDGCLMEGISHEAASLAGHLKLDHLVCIFDDNKITIDGSTALACSDDAPARFRSYGWNVIEAGEIANDCDALEKVLLAARDHTGAPTLVVLRSHIGFPSPDLTDKHEAHGNPFTAPLVSATKKVMGIPDEPFYAPEAFVSEYRAFCRARGQDAHAEWKKRTQSLSSVLTPSSFGVADKQEIASVLPVFPSDTNWRHAKPSKKCWRPPEKLYRSCLLAQRISLAIPVPNWPQQVDIQRRTPLANRSITEFVSTRWVPQWLAWRFMVACFLSVAHSLCSPTTCVLQFD